MNLKISSLSLLVLPVVLLSACGGNRKKTAATVAPAPASVAPAPPAADPADRPFVGQKRTTATGIRYEVLEVGTGIRPKAFDRVKVHYHGYLPDGTVFDSSMQRGEPIIFGLNEVIPGWTEGVQLMPEGSTYRFFIPWLQAYGLKGSPPNIGPKQDLMFDIQLIQVLQ